MDVNYKHKFIYIFKVYLNKKFANRLLQLYNQDRTNSVQKLLDFT